MRRMVKEGLLKFDGTPLFPERIAYTVPYKLSPAEAKKQSKAIEDEFGKRKEELHEQLTEALSNILLGEKIPLDVTNAETGEIIIPANRKITKTLLKKLAAVYDKIEIDPSPIRNKISEIIGKRAQKVSQLAFLHLLQRDLAYQVEAPTLWDIDFRTAVAQAELEDREMLRQRVVEASAYVSMERLCLSPQCGFSGNVGNTVMSAGEQFNKLRLVVETARSLWGDA